MEENDRPQEDSDRFRKLPGPIHECRLPILPALAAEDDDFFQRKEVPHGRIEKVFYTSHNGCKKRMHVYLPPGYDAERQRDYPVLYLNHGGGQDDASWTSVSHDSGGSAHWILDNLIADGTAVPMLIAMPDSRDFVSGEPPDPVTGDSGTREYLLDIIPFMESRFRARTGREHRAIAGLSMGGFIVLNTGFARLDTFSELYVFSSGYRSEKDRNAFERKFQPILEHPETDGKFRVPFYMAQGETDLARLNAQKVMAIFNRYGIRNFWVLSSGGHEWKNWRRYLHNAAQIMFPGDRRAGG